MMVIDIDRRDRLHVRARLRAGRRAGVMFALRVPTNVAIGFIAGLKASSAAVISAASGPSRAMVAAWARFAESYTSYISTHGPDLILLAARARHALPGPMACSGAHMPKV